MAIGGWTDGYTDAVLRLLEHLDVPRRGLIGPWGHNDPVHGVPAPAVGSLGECVRFFDRWLKGIANGIDDGADADRLAAGLRARRARATTSGRDAGSPRRPGRRPRSASCGST